MLKFNLLTSTFLPALGLLFAANLHAATFNGPWQQGALIIGQLAAGESAVFNGKNLKKTKEGKVVFGLGRDAPATAKVIIKHTDGSQKTLSFPVEQRQYDIQKITGVEQKHVEPSAEFTARINREAAAVASVRKKSSDRTDFLSTFIWPAKGPVTGVYGSQRFYNGIPKNPHFGIDIAGPKGAAVNAPAAGKVIFANDDLFFSGGTLIVDHGFGINSTFIHLSKIEVKLGDEVKQGDLIARIGATGRATGPHLDWRINWFDERLDPQLLFPKNSKPALK
ncbi:MAG: M23 family metallopeptidase [Marinagarivorans sp.]|nr:M23 family metallopeptidase [Marinagarivorans sp.]